MTAESPATREGSTDTDEQRALLVERVRFVFSIGPNEMFPLAPAARASRGRTTP